MKILGPHEQTKDKELMGDVCEPIENRWRTNGKPTENRGRGDGAPTENRVRVDGEPKETN